MTLSAGVAVRDITPQKPLFLVGYPHVPRTSTGVHDPLLASALFLSDGQASLLLIGLDIVFIGHESARLCREAIAKATGLPPSHILISATHTHSGPVTTDMLIWESDPVVTPTDPGYLDQFHQAIIAAGTEAHGRAVPAELAVASATVSGVGGNRLSADGVRDPEVGLWFVRRADNHRPLALSLVYCMHPTVLHEDSTLVSGDFPTYTRQPLQEALPGLTVIYHTGPSGNQSPRHHVRGQTFAEAERLGRALGDAVLAGLRPLQDKDFTNRVPLAAAREFVELPARKFPPAAEARAVLKRAVDNFEKLKREKAERALVRTAECVVFGAEELVTLAAAQESGLTEACRRQYTPTEVQVFRAGDAYLVGLPGELFVEYGLELKRRAPGRTFVIELANGELQGYIVTPEADAASGYEATCSFFRPEAGRLMVETALKLMKQLAKDRPARS